MTLGGISGPLGDNDEVSVCISSLHEISSTKHVCRGV